jgi:hypothetical protein
MRREIGITDTNIIVSDVIPNLSAPIVMPKYTLLANLRMVLIMSKSAPILSPCFKIYLINKLIYLNKNKK